MQGQFKEKPVIPFYFQARESPVSATSASPRKPQGISAQTLRSNNNNRKTEERRNWYRKFAFEKVQGFPRFPPSSPRFQSFVLLLSLLFVMHFIALKTLDSPMKLQQIPHIILISMNHDSVRIQKKRSTILYSSRTVVCLLLPRGTPRNPWNTFLNCMLG